jgi:hypothetical protein
MKEIEIIKLLPKFDIFFKQNRGNLLYILKNLIIFIETIRQSMSNEKRKKIQTNKIIDKTEQHRVYNFILIHNFK